MSIFAALIEAAVGEAAGKMIESLFNDGPYDPVYKRKLEELIERNRQFEEERNRA